LEENRFLEGKGHPFLLRRNRDKEGGCLKGEFTDAQSIIIPINI
jgi:hypothetical protein